MRSTQITYSANGQFSREYGSDSRRTSKRHQPEAVPPGSAVPKLCDTKTESAYQESVAQQAVVSRSDDNHDGPLRANSSCVDELIYDDRAEWEDVLRDGLLAIEDHPLFQQYCDLFFRYFKRTNYHEKTGYERGFIAPSQKKYKDGSGTYAPRWHDKLIARHLDADPTRPYWLGLRLGTKTTLRCIDFDNKVNVLGHYTVGKVYRPVAHLPLAHFKAMKRLYDALPGHIWCVSSATLGLHVWTKLRSPLSVEVVERLTRPILKTIGLGNTEVFPSPSKINHVLRRPFGLDYHTITDAGLLSDWQEQTKYFVATTKPPAFAAIVLSMLKLATQEWERCERQNTFTRSQETPLASKRFLHLKSLRAEARQVIDWVRAGCPDDNPVMLNMDAPVADKPKALPVMNASASRRRQCASNPLTEKWSWSKIRKLARDGVPEEDKLFQYLLLLARPLIWREYYHLDEDERTRRTEEDLLYWVENKHNGLVTRVLQGDMANVLHEIRQQIRAAVEKTDLSLQKFYARMREQDQLHPAKVERLSDIIRDKENSSSSLVCCRRINKEPDDSALPTAVEERLLNVVKSEQMRRRGGEYPFVRFARRLLNLLWAEDGAAHLHRDNLFEFCVSKNPNQVLSYKKIMAEIRLISDQWALYVQRGVASAVYEMTDSTFDEFQKHFGTTKSKKQMPPPPFTITTQTEEQLSSVAWGWE